MICFLAGDSVNRQNCSGVQMLRSVLNRRPNAIARIRGSKSYDNILGMVWFYQTSKGVYVVTEVDGLPQGCGECKSPVFGYHIHSGSACAGNMEDAFADTRGHYNPDNCEHPHHAGDMPLLFGNHGYAFSVFYSDRFCVCDIIGKTVIIHLNPDDFHTQPAGNSGTKIACGKIEA